MQNCLQGLSIFWKIDLFCTNLASCSWASCYCPLLGRTRSRGRYWAAIRLSCHPELLGQALHGEVNWTVNDNMVNGLFLCATLTSCRRGHTRLVGAGEKTSDTGVEAVKRNPCCSWQGHSRRWMPMSEMKLQSLAVLSNHSAFHWWSAHSTALLLLMSDELMSCCAAGTNGSLDLRCCAFLPSERVGTEQGRVCIFGALGYFKLGGPLKGLRQLTSYKSALRVLATFTEQVVTVHKYIPLFWTPSIQGKRAVSTALHTPQLGCYTVTMAPKFRA